MTACAIPSAGVRRALALIVAAVLRPHAEPNKIAGISQSAGIAVVTRFAEGACRSLDDVFDRIQMDIVSLPIGRHDVGLDVGVFLNVGDRIPLALGAGSRRLAAGHAAEKKSNEEEPPHFTSPCKTV
jgi:hypothetical protein